MLSKAVSAARRQLLDISTNLSNQVHGLIKTFGLVVPKGKGRIFEANVRRLLDEEHVLSNKQTTVGKPRLDAFRNWADAALIGRRSLAPGSSQRKPATPACTSPVSAASSGASSSSLISMKHQYG
jgi:hypothetical protein